MATTLRVDLKGAQELRRRLKALRQTFKPVGREWADTAAAEARRRIPVVTGATRDSIRRTHATQRKAEVGGSYVTRFIAAGTRAHDITPRKMSVLRFEDGGQTIFARRVHKRATPGRPFRRASAEAGLRKVDILRTLVELWNRAA